MEFFLYFLRDKYLIHSKLWGRYSSSFRGLWIGLLSFVFRFLYLNFNFSRGKTKKSDCWVIWKVYVELYKKLYWKTVFHCGYRFVFSPAKYECFSCPLSLPAWYQIFLMSAISIGTQQYLTVILIYIYLIVNDVEYLFTWLFAMSISSLVECLFQFLAIF